MESEKNEEKRERGSCGNFIFTLAKNCRCAPYCATTIERGEGGGERDEIIKCVGQTRRNE